MSSIISDFHWNFLQIIRVITSEAFSRPGLEAFQKDLSLVDEDFRLLLSYCKCRLFTENLLLDTVFEIFKICAQVKLPLFKLAQNTKEALGSSGQCPAVSNSSNEGLSLRSGLLVNEEAHCPPNDQTSHKQLVTSQLYFDTFDTHPFSILGHWFKMYRTLSWQSTFQIVGE